MLYFPARWELSCSYCSHLCRLDTVLEDARSEVAVCLLFSDCKKLSA